MSSEITVPYAFVPLSKWVYVPEWSYRVSHDIPLDESLSGAIDLRLKNSTELCVGGSGNKSDKSNTVKWAATPDGKLIIPGSSIKGMLRNIIEIAGFGKFSGFVNRKTSFRELKTKSDYMNRYSSYTQEAAFLDRDEQGWFVRTCKCARLYNREINEKLFNKKEVIKNYDPKCGKNESKKQGGSVPQQTAIKKYELAVNNGQQDILEHQYSAKIEDINAISGIKKKAILASDGKETGYIVFCNLRIVADLKNPEKYDYSYFYYDVKQEKIRINDDEIIRNFQSSQEPELIKFLFSKHNKKLGIPVWVMKTGREIKELGICRMPRLMNTYSVKDLAENQQGNFQKEHLYDLAEILFGTIYTGSEINVNMSLKSRICCSDFISEKSENTVSRKMCLQGPKISFNNAYLTKGTYSTVDTNLSGWKRYKILNQLYIPENEVTDSQESNVYFTNPGTIFNGTIVFHNLSMIELGALLWSINFMQQDGCFHSLGHGKPYGAGAVLFDNIKLRFPSYEKNVSTDINEYMDLFVKHMNGQYPAKDGAIDPWLNSPQIENLKSIAQIHSDLPDKIYNKLDDFRDIKNNGTYLEYEETVEDNTDPKKVSSIPDYIPVGLLTDVLKLPEKIVGKELVEKWKKEKEEKRLNSLNLSEEEKILIKEINELEGKLFDLCGNDKYDESVPKIKSNLPLQQIKEKFKRHFEKIKKGNEIDSLVISSFIKLYTSRGLEPLIFKISDKIKKNEAKKAEIENMKNEFNELKKKI